MGHLEMIFSILSAILIIGVVVIIFVKKFRRSGYLLSYLEPGDPTPESYRRSERTKNRYFPLPSGVIDLKKHPELLRFKEISGDKEYLVEPWKRDKNLYLNEGNTKVVIFEFIQDGDRTIAIPCLRLAESIIERENNNPLLHYKSIFLGVLWGKGKRRIVESEKLLGIVRYESV